MNKKQARKKFSILSLSKLNDHTIGGQFFVVVAVFSIKIIDFKTLIKTKNPPFFHNKKTIYIYLKFVPPFFLLCYSFSQMFKQTLDLG